MNAALYCCRACSGSMPTLWPARPRQTVPPHRLPSGGLIRSSLHHSSGGDFCGCILARQRRKAARFAALAARIGTGSALGTLSKSSARVEAAAFSRILERFPVFYAVISPPGKNMRMAESALGIRRHEPRQKGKAVPPLLFYHGVKAPPACITSPRAPSRIMAQGSSRSMASTAS